MLGLLVLAAAVWFGGHALDVPKRVRWGILGLLYLAVLAGLWLSPDALGPRLGGGAGEWLVLGVAGLAIWAYSKLLRRLRTRAQPDAPQTQSTTFSETELDRYARHIVMHDIGGAGQKRLREARVLVIGAGGLGAPVLQYLGAAGVGTLGVIDDDLVENSNLGRQVLHKDRSIGTPKVFSAEAELLAQNPHITVRPYHRRLDADCAADLFADYDLVLDGSDNFDTRYLVNQTAHATKTPLISGALTQWEGQVALFDYQPGSACYECVFPTRPTAGQVLSCAEAGVLGPLPGVVGSMMAVEAIKHITRAGETLRGRMVIYDALYASSREIKLLPRADCAVCGEEKAKENNV